MVRDVLDAAQSNNLMSAAHITLLSMHVEDNEAKRKPSKHVDRISRRC